ncbi:glycosyl hydrolase [Faecalicatena orotica]|uniref:glycosyl hydrolase n=1 Tax=Faecalicatena orotica TaxID=1544 RepID=UPI003216D675
MKKEIWKDPQKEKSLDGAQSPLWFWNDRLDEKELIRQLEMQTENGVASTIPHARTNGGEGYIGGYLDEEWFDHIKTVLEYKREHKEPVWMYDEIDWPAGTCNKTITQDERNREQYLSFTREKIPAGTPFRAQLKDLRGKPLGKLKEDTDKSGCAFNIFILDAETREQYDITNYFKYLIFGPELEFVSDRDALAYIAKVRVDAYEYGGSNQVNYLDASATGAFLSSTYEKYYERFSSYFGSTIKCFFNDETRMCNPLAWSRDLPDVFRQRKGYDLMPHLVDLVLPGEKAGRTKCDYFDVLAYLFQENYFGEIHRWCEKHDTKLFAHLLGEETLYGHIRYSGDYLRQNKYLDIPGADHLGKGIGSLNIKYTASGAHSYGHEMTAVEVFAGCGWDFTFEEYIRMISWLYQQGMQVIINHGFFYSDRGERKNDWPPSQFFQWQGWPRMKEGNAMVRRLHYALTGGMNEMDILVYHPIESVWLNYEPDLNYTHGFAEGGFLGNGQAAKIDKEMQVLMNGLMSENLDYELMHKDACNNFKASGGKIRNRRTGQEFSVLILPMCRVLPVEAARLCLEFTQQGGKLIALDEIPVYAMPREKDKELAGIFQAIKKTGNLVILPVEEKERLYAYIRANIPAPVTIVEGTGKTVNSHPHYPDYMIDPYLHNGENITGVQFTRYVKDGKRNTLFVNYGEAEETILVKLEAEEIPEIWDTFTGEVKKAEVTEHVGGYYTVRLTLPCNYGVFLVG